MTYLILGAGMMGKAIAFDLLKHSRENFIIADRDDKALSDVKFFLHDPIETIRIDDIDDIKRVFSKIDIIISALPYRYNYRLAKIAIEGEKDFIDLGGNTDIVLKEKELDGEAKDKKVTVIPDCGLAPGLVSVIAHDIFDEYDEVESIHIRVGGIPINPNPPFNYQKVFSLEGLINEYVEDAIVIENGDIRYKKSLTEVEDIIFPEPFGRMEAFITSGGTSTLPYTYKGRIKNLEYKTIRYPGHCEKFKILVDIGMCSDKPIEIEGRKIIPRYILIHLLDQILPSEGEDAVLLKTIANGIRKDEYVYCEYNMIDRYDSETGLSAMMRTTGFPVSITAEMIQNDIIKEYGVFTPEEVIPPKLFFKELEKRGIAIRKEFKIV
ncbi:MAG TPA: saccharopine dehydrogenase [Thermoplasmatales archaeon]|nr:saccharopine dehydrogenase [Thermoplasmatales archaeon]